MISINKPAIDFTLPSTSDQDITLSSFKNKNNIILYFYPKDDTPGCTKEAQDFNYILDKLSNLDTIVFGISCDTIKKHKVFKSKYNLDFDLLSDWQHEVVNKYNVWVEKSMYGKKYMGIRRSTFIINKDFNVIKVWDNVKIQSHSVEVLTFLNNYAD